MKFLLQLTLLILISSCSNDEQSELNPEESLPTIEAVVETCELNLNPRITFDSIFTLEEDLGYGDFRNQLSNFFDRENETEQYIKVTKDGSSFVFHYHRWKNGEIKTYRDGILEVDRFMLRNEDILRSEISKLIINSSLYEKTKRRDFGHENINGFHVMLKSRNERINVCEDLIKIDQLFKEEFNQINHELKGRTICNEVERNQYFEDRCYVVYHSR